MPLYIATRHRLPWILVEGRGINRDLPLLLLLLLQIGRVVIDRFRERQEEEAEEWGHRCAPQSGVQDE